MKYCRALPALLLPILLAGCGGSSGGPQASTSTTAKAPDPTSSGPWRGWSGINAAAKAICVSGQPDMPHLITVARLGTVSQLPDLYRQGINRGEPDWLSELPGTTVVGLCVVHDTVMVPENVLLVALPNATGGDFVDYWAD